MGVMGVFWGSGEVGWPEGGVGGMGGILWGCRFVLMGLRLAMLILRSWLVRGVTIVGRCTGWTYAWGGGIGETGEKGAV